MQNVGHYQPFAGSALCKGFRHFRCLYSHPSHSIIRLASDSGASKVNLQRDNRTKHTVTVIKDCHQQGVLQQMARPPQSPDLSVVGSSLGSHEETGHWDGPSPPKRRGSFSKVLLTTHLPRTRKKNMQRSIGAVLKENGGHTKHWYFFKIIW